MYIHIHTYIIYLPALRPEDLAPDAGRRGDFARLHHHLRADQRIGRY